VQLGERRPDQRNPGGLVSLPAVALRCEEWGVGLDEQAVTGNRARHVPECHALLERDDAGEGDREAFVEGAAREGERARITVEYALERTAALGDPDLEQLVVGALVVAAHVDRDRERTLPREHNLLGEDRPLDRARRVHVVVVEATLADGDDPLVVEPGLQQSPIFVAEALGIVWMDTGRREDARIRLGERDRVGVAFGPVARADRDEGFDAGREGALEHRAAVQHEAFRGDVAMTVEPHG
jgi:hypothetical protein